MYNTLEKLYYIADKEKINIFENNWSSALARIFEIDNNYIIALSRDNIENSFQEKEILAEELGHYYCNALYYLNDNPTQKAKCEYRAKKWAYSVLVPIQILSQKLLDGINSIYELAEYFDLEPTYMAECLNFYNEIGALSKKV